MSERTGACSPGCRHPVCLDIGRAREAKAAECVRVMLEQHRTEAEEAQAKIARLVAERDALALRARDASDEYIGDAVRELFSAEDEVYSVAGRTREPNRDAWNAAVAREKVARAKLRAMVGR